MIERLIEWSMRNRFVVACASFFIVALGIHAVLTAPVDAIPDLGEHQVIVFADWPGRGPQEIETQVTQPLSLSLQGLPGVKTVRATSMSGFSLVTLIFEDDTDTAVARQRVLERLNYLRAKAPPGVEPTLGPDATGLGWIFQYHLEVDPAKGRFHLGELRTLQDSFIRPQISSVPGVAEVGSVGGFVKQYQIEVDSLKMRAAGVTMNQLMDAVGRAGSLGVGGRTIEENGMEFVVRGVALLHGADDIAKIVLAEKDGADVRLADVARVEIGGDFRRGSLDAGGHEVVGGIVVMRTGGNAREVIRRVKEKIAQLQPGLPAGVSIKPFYDRGRLIDRSLDTLKLALTEEIILVILAHIIFLWHFRSILIVTLPLPVSILVSFIGLKHFGITSNIMSLSGIAIAIGVLVDGAIVVTENVLRRCADHPAAEDRAGVVLAAARQVARPIFFAMAIIILAFVPVFALTGQEGRLFHPLACAKTFAMIGAALLSVTLVPVLCTVFMRGPFHAEERNAVMRFLLRLYDPVLRAALHCRKSVLALAALILAGALALVPRMGAEFMPPLNEGSLLFMPTFVPGTAFSEAKRVMAWQDQIFASTPEIESAVGKLGRADTATDPAPVEMIETTIMLKPENQWRTGMTRRNLIAELTERLRKVPGFVPGFLQPIEGRVLMLSTGVRAQLGVKLFGDDPALLQNWAFEVEKIVRDVRGATGVTSSRVQGRPVVEIEPDRDALARYGVPARDVLEVIETGIGGTEAGVVLENRARVPIQVRLQRGEREDIERLREIPVSMPGGKALPLGQLAAIRRTSGPGEITSENGRLSVFVQANVDGTQRDLGGFVEEVKARVANEITPRLPKGITIGYSGDYENRLHAMRTLRLIVPCVLLIIFLLLHQVYRSVKEAAHVLLAVPFALSGGVFLQYALGVPFSVAVWVGYIALFGTAIQTAIVMVVYLDEAVARARAVRGADFSTADLVQAAIDGARLRLRPKVMTVATIVASLLPMLWSTRTGAEIMRPIAVPVIGGMVSSLAHILIVTPVIFVWLRQSTGSVKTA
ncbi:MAG: CusA/CzcA family heavy metal efflux RND transporter [Verrucomicrobiaceae bacterium]|nr:CusA/CzcA family heavy metal efflux RND transporter [Verrucomicrobiaceae bacterium]